MRCYIKRDCRGSNVLPVQSVDVCYSIAMTLKLSRTLYTAIYQVPLTTGLQINMTSLCQLL